MHFGRLTLRNLYWICQIGGWLLYTISVLIFVLPNSNLSEEDAGHLTTAFSVILSSASGLLLTHTLRLIVNRYHWIKLPAIRLVIQTLIACGILSTIYNLISIGLDKLLLHPKGDLEPEILLLSFLNAYLIFFLWSVLYFAVKIFRNYKKQEIEHLKWESAIKDFELNKLKSQLNPHFVFNALNSIRALIDEDPIKAKTATTQLSNILRNSLLADRNKTVPLSEELKTVNDYLNLEKIRYEDRLNVLMDVEPVILSFQVPPMMIQTIVENAVKHGISKQVGKGFIHVRARPLRDLLEVQIKNSGRLGSAESPTGFGIINTKQRLELLYGNSRGFNITQEGDDTVAVSLLIPPYKS